ISGGLLGGLLAGEAHAQFPHHGLPPGAMPMPPIGAPQMWVPPLMYVRVAGPKGMKATFFQGAAKGQTFGAPCVVGLRPGYTYRIALSDVPDHPNRVFFPALEVRTSLLLGYGLRNAEFPATLNFTEEDFTRSQDGAFIRKVVV